jgi:hypothetical protein
LGYIGWIDVLLRGSVQAFEEATTGSSTLSACGFMTDTALFLELLA